MRILIAAVFTLLINVAYWVQFRGFEILKDYLPFRDLDISKDLALLLLSVYFILESLMLIRKNQRSAELALESEHHDKELLEQGLSEVGELHREVESLQSELIQAKNELAHTSERLRKQVEERDALRLAFEEVNTRLVQQGKHSDGQIANPQDEFIHAEIVNFLGLLQQKGRFIDFLMDDISPYRDEQVGAAARVVHQGCRSIIKEYFDIAPVFTGNEGERIQLEQNFNLEQFRLVGRVLGEPPFHGTVLHRGWKTNEITLPRLLHGEKAKQSEIIAPAEVEVNS